MTSKYKQNIKFAFVKSLPVMAGYMVLGIGGNSVFGRDFALCGNFDAGRVLSKGYTRVDWKSWSARADCGFGSYRIT